MGRGAWTALLAAVLGAGCLGGRVPSPYRPLMQERDPRLWLAPYEHVVEADYPEPCCYPDPPYLTRRLDDYYWRRGDPWYYPQRPPRIRLGRGRYSLLAPSDAVLMCEFPPSEDIVSNVVWVRADLSALDVRAGHQARSGDCRPRVVPGHQGSSLYLPGAGPLDEGLYRCLATSRRPGGRVETIFQDVEFFPRLWSHRPR